MKPSKIKFLIVRAKNRGPKINTDVNIKLCDLGNGCWTYHHFSSEIQTRQYRSPEVRIPI